MLCCFPPNATLSSRYTKVIMKHNGKETDHLNPDYHCSFHGRLSERRAIRSQTTR